MSERDAVLSIAEVNAMTGDDIEFWLNNQFMSPDMLAEKVCWWITSARAKALQEAADELATTTHLPEYARLIASTIVKDRAALVAPSRVPGEES